MTSYPIANDVTLKGIAKIVQCLSTTKEKMQKAEYSWQIKSEWLQAEFMTFCVTRESIIKVRTMQDKRSLQSTKGQLQAASQCSQMIEKANIFCEP